MDVNSELLIVLGGIGVIVLAWLLLRFGKIIGRVLLTAGIIAGAIIGLLALLAQAGANYQSAKSAREATQTAKVAVAGQTMILVSFIIVLVALLFTVIYLWFRLQRVQRDYDGKKKWTPGPNALWSRTEDPSSLAQAGGDSGESRLLLPLLMQQMMMMQQMVMSSMQQRNTLPPQSGDPSLPALPSPPPADEIPWWNDDWSW